MIVQAVSSLLVASLSLLFGEALKRMARWTISPFDSFLLGFAAVNSLLTLLSLCVPINATVVLIGLILSVCRILFARKYICQSCQQFKVWMRTMPTSDRLIVALFCWFLFIVFCLSLYPASLHYDTGLYHTQTIRWITEYPTVIGLANLHYRFGFNSNIYTWFALTSSYPFTNQFVYSVNLVITSFFSLFILSRLLKILRERKFIYATGLVFALFVLIRYFLPHISSASNDLTAFVYVAVLLLRMNDVQKGDDFIPLACVLSFYTITIKLSAAPILFLGLVIFFCEKYYRFRKQDFLLSAMAVFMVLPWLIKNMLLSGWILFPFAALDLFSVKWKVPSDRVAYLQTRITSLARGREGPVVPDAPWFSDWLSAQSWIDLGIFGAAIIIFSYLLLLLVTGRLSTGKYQIAVLITAFFGVVYWFVTGPAFRFGMGFILVTILCGLHYDRPSFYKIKWIPSLSLIVLFASFFSSTYYHPWHFIKHLRERIYLPYAENKLDRVGYFYIDHKIKCFYPLNGNQCFGEAFPCSIEKLQDIHLRGTDIVDGFYYDQKGDKNLSARKSGDW